MNILNTRAATPPRGSIGPNRVDADLAFDLYRRLGSWPRVAEVLRGPHGETYKAKSVRLAVWPTPSRWRLKLHRFARMAVELQRQERKNQL